MGKSTGGRRTVVLERDNSASTTEIPSSADIVTALQHIFGQKLTAFMAGTYNTSDVGKWARGEAPPPPDAARRLTEVHGIAQLLLRYESPVGVCSWFLGMNPELDDRAPAEVVGEHPDLVRDAAHVYIATG